MGVGADDDGDAQLVHVAQGVAGGVVVGVAPFVKTAGVHLADAACFVDELHSLVHEVAEPRLVVVEITVPVVHDYLVKMAHDGGLLALNHAVVLVKEAAGGMADVPAKKALQALVVGLVAGAVNHPQVFCGLGWVVAEVIHVVRRGDEVYAADGVLQPALFNEGREILAQPRNVVYLKPKANIYAVGKLLCKCSDGVAILKVSVRMDGEGVGVGQG